MRFPGCRSVPAPAIGVTPVAGVSSNWGYAHGSDMTGRVVAGWAIVGEVLQLVETGTDNRARSVDVMEISRSADLGEIANLGLTLPEASRSWRACSKRWWRRKPTIMRHCGRTARPAAGDATSRTGGFIRSRRCSARWRCGFRGFAAPAVVAPRLVSAGHRIVGRHRSWISCELIFPPSCPFRVAAGVLAHLLPVEAGKSPETLRGAIRSRALVQFVAHPILPVF